jgi:hypothetical protein
VSQAKLSVLSGLRLRLYVLAETRCADPGAPMILLARHSLFHNIFKISFSIQKRRYNDIDYIVGRLPMVKIYSSVKSIMTCNPLPTMALLF